jgi:hypothetical protein
MKLIHTSLLLFLILTIYSCKDSKYRFDDYNIQSTRLTELIPLQTGKYIIYRLDSTIPVNLGRDLAVRHYRIKDEIAEPYTDNLGQPGYKVIRSISDSSGTTPWKPISTYYITPLRDRIEVVENNLRIKKLVVPLKLDVTWKGYSSLPYSPFGEFAHQGLNEVNTWDFAYTGFGQETIGNIVIDSVWTVQHLNLVPDSSSVLFETGLSEEKYAKNIGLVSKEFILLETAKNQMDPSDQYTIGFGVKMWMIEHN